ncbi:D-glycero-beta-D-manno-heptose-7-phosphate kinase [Oxalobacter aliiformigenes]|uniref:D-glycero-beta-D-manno-heptose-7-phosphate kinase n=1 Tax=Oxalobacter aliiformigenes TaxID=2946593 RepID=UPI0022AFC1C0|nr:D-glycero-beta-D-manno-heptose-7-phosphate kinase [Oxalobacter aliiformigenes]MCZ4064444.1 D-glycero-beta-D-manno-heptose-7-phosphate kinase [Oxalobacter aliiformigenes]WAV99788.1 D-glycero-beta-D-manno-heptose-7-phosphate kinase [Oxalobacter aliiformigenes]
MFDALINRFPNVRALVIGDIMLDTFVYGEVDRISPEAPVPVFKYRQKTEMLGGAGNVAANLAALGCITTFIGIVGNDSTGRKIASLLNKAGTKCHLLKLNGYPTIIKTRFVAKTNHLLRMDNEEVLPVITALLPRIKKILNRAISAADIVLVSDYNKGLLTHETTPIVIDICNKLHKKVIIDPKGHDYSKYAGATLVKPNLKEFSEATGKKYYPLSPNFQPEIIKEAKHLFEQYKIENLVITLSEHGMLHIPSEHPNVVEKISAQVKEVCDVSGAGDTALASLGASLGAGASISDAMKLANIAAGIVVGKLGTSTLSYDELKKSLMVQERENHHINPENKIVTLEQAEYLVKKLKSRGKIIGFTNGCFDCCHLGHLSSLLQARKYCDVLFVAINSDLSIKRLKGNDRPVQDEKTRSMLIASLEYVDYVLIFNDDTPLAIIEKLRPDILAKEGYRIDEWPEATFASHYGAKIITLDRVKGYSTTNLIEKMKH